MKRPLRTGVFGAGLIALLFVGVAGGVAIDIVKNNPIGAAADTLLIWTLIESNAAIEKDAQAKEERLLCYLNGEID